MIRAMYCALSLGAVLVLTSGCQEAPASAANACTSMSASDLPQVQLRQREDMQLQAGRPNLEMTLRHHSCAQPPPPRIDRMIPPIPMT